MRRKDVDEAAAVLRRLLDYLMLVATTSADEVAAADFRQAVGALRAGAETAIENGTLGTQLAACFVNCRLAGATFDQFDAARLTAIAEDPSGSPAIITVGAYIRQALVAMARVISDHAFSSRDEVENWRNRISAAFDEAEDDAAEELDSSSYQILVALHAASIRDLTVRARPLPRMASFAFAMRLPSLWIANRLYGDGGRYQEIINENRVVHPLFVPQEGRALAR